MKKALAITITLTAIGVAVRVNEKKVRAYSLVNSKCVVSLATGKNSATIIIQDADSIQTYKLLPIK